jgi:hypothetical protein
MSELPTCRDRCFRMPPPTDNPQDLDDLVPTGSEFDGSDTIFGFVENLSPNQLAGDSIHVALP